MDGPKNSPIFLLTPLNFCKSKKRLKIQETSGREQQILLVSTSWWFDILTPAHIRRPARLSGFRAQAQVPASALAASPGRSWSPSPSPLANPPNSQRSPAVVPSGGRSASFVFFFFLRGPNFAEKGKGPVFVLFFASTPWILFGLKPSNLLVLKYPFLCVGPVKPACFEMGSP